ncbi:putative zinc-finger Ran-binding domain, related protein [Toxoplasma gondii TgCatPRC2]|uniref:RanBP2-type domain-containing protein n=5 Tax=Toxoplasma gondii TaxID=5811 RepID=S8EWM4_TOXGM|nr:hypothetical protein TGME49_234460 [Toxoplasma gondii ME49]KFG45982.1 putative zinc-finger Ran-binding domain, related protein [Toxoplasma gondii GAB2-2007-GAL-DOM2]KYF42353.1 putative zinc-finger Ran-binding domain, related protein [Toxoplasma gondii ARI]KYK71567.1 putative zinc-finger Ran-binding domain, related protein [Toxoplasma gondii TgCatPRC2]PIM03671.1 putative zinc-finger Ran-binding domain, related protein [Toxoplasma gondii COUG]EPT26787.1 hypothetical protein TGME49_234460 [Tox|eukprot:XP_002368886.1 hypothetical protein TGME49_234460 [Toxoplasma gondii ME49]
MESIVSEVAQKTVLILVDEFISQGDEAPLDRTVEILQIALLSCEAKKSAAKCLSAGPGGSGSSEAAPLLSDGQPVDGLTRTREALANSASRSSSAGQAEVGSSRRTQGQVLGGGVHFAAPRVLVPPENLKNPSSFLKIYGDPLCFAGSRNLVAGCRGNWKCAKCGTVNFPRRFRCKQCDKERDEEGHRIVLEYAKTVYQQYLAAGLWPVWYAADRGGPLDARSLTPTGLTVRTTQLYKLRWLPTWSTGRDYCNVTSFEMFCSWTLAVPRVLYENKTIIGD